jgi:hypothetical protein
MKKLILSFAQEGSKKGGNALHPFEATKRVGYTDPFEVGVCR